MVEEKTNRLSREDWIRGAFELLRTRGVEGVKIVPLADRLGVTSGSFYWHFPNRKALMGALLEGWEREMTDEAIESARHFEGSPEERIWSVMEMVMDAGLARYDLAVWQWAQSDPMAREVFQRIVDKRFGFAAWMFRQAGFNEAQAEARGRMMVVYLMGESTLVPDSRKDRQKKLRLKFEILTH